MESGGVWWSKELGGVRWIRCLIVLRQGLNPSNKRLNYIRTEIHNREKDRYKGDRILFMSATSLHYNPFLPKHFLLYPGYLPVASILVM